jgi:hypothetical protein
MITPKFIILFHLTDAYSDMKQLCFSGLRSDFKMFVTPITNFYGRVSFEHNLVKLQ